MNEHPVKHIGDLRVGDIVRNRGSGDAMVIVKTFGASAIAVRTTTVTNPSEWVRIDPEAR